MAPADGNSAGPTPGPARESGQTGKGATKPQGPENRASAAAVKRVAVVGGGWAGLAAAVEATERGHDVTLFEMAAQLGGRARAVDTPNGPTLDNGQHILIGAYRATLRLLRTIGVDPAAAFRRTPLRLVYPDGSGLRLGRGPAALAFAVAVSRLPGWTLGERLALLAAASRWAAHGFRCDPSWSVATLTGRLPVRVRRELIDPLCVAALNTPAADASASVFLRVMQDALLSGAGSADLLLPRVDLGKLVPTPAAIWLQRAGATLLPGRRVAGIEPMADGRWRIDGGGGSADPAGSRQFEHIILACAPKESARLARKLAPEWSATALGLRFEPIVTVYLSVPGASLAEPMLALHQEDDDAPAQFVFDRGQLGGPAGLLAFVVSGAADWVARGTPALEAAVLRQARRLLAKSEAANSAAFDARPVTLTEKRATFRCTPGVSRPGMRIAPGLSAAGDHVDGPYPATLEGAVRSGVAAARAIDDAERTPLSGARTVPPTARR